MNFWGRRRVLYSFGSWLINHNAVITVIRCLRVLVQVQTLHTATATVRTCWRSYSRWFRTKTGWWKTCTPTWGNPSTRCQTIFGSSVRQRLSSSSLAVRRSHSTILVCKRRIVDLFPKLETAVTDIKNAETGVVQMQMKRQKEFWFLLKIACVSIRKHCKNDTCFSWTRC